MNVFILISTLITTAASAVTLLAALGFNVRIRGRSTTTAKTSVDSTFAEKIKRVRVATFLSILSICMSSFAAYYFFRPRVLVKTVEKQMLQTCPKIPDCPKLAVPTATRKPKGPVVQGSVPIAPQATAPQTCTNCNQAGVNNGQQFYVNNRNPLPQIAVLSSSPISRSGIGIDNPMPIPVPRGPQPPPPVYNPGIAVVLELKGVFYSPAFLVDCSVPCEFIHAFIEDRGSEISNGDYDSLSAKNHMSAGVSYKTGPMYPGTKLRLTFRSLDSRSLEVSNVRPYAPE